MPFLTEVAGKRSFSAIVPVSATNGRQLDEPFGEVRKHLPHDELLFAEDEMTDKSSRFIAAEYIREKLFRLLGDELPYSTTVEIEKFEEEGALKRIFAAIVVDRPGHKAIVIGKGWRDAEAHRHRGAAGHGAPVRRQGLHLEIWVKVKSGWTDDERLLKSLGYE